MNDNNQLKEIKSTEIIQCKQLDLADYDEFTAIPRLHSVSEKAEMKSKGIRACSDCGLTYKRWHSYHVHKRTHAKNIHLCDMCAYATNIPEKLTKHKQGHTTEMHRCDRCIYYCHSAEQLEEHKSLHVQDVITCEYCDFEAASDTSLKEHFNDIHFINELYCCRYCDFSFPNVTSLKIHCSERHQIERTVENCFAEIKTEDIKQEANALEPDFNCTYPEVKLTTYDNQLFHCTCCQYDLSVILKEQSDKAFVSCPRCGVKYDSHLTGGNHLRRNGLVYIYCDKCEFKCLTEDGMKNHKLEHVNEEKFRNAIHNIVSSNFPHISNETNQEPALSCNKCNFECTDFSEYEEHSQGHQNNLNGLEAGTSEKVFQCSHCDYKNDCLDSYKMHLLSHLDRREISEVKEKPSLMGHGTLSKKVYTCSQCKYSSQQLSKLQAHQLVHKTAKPFQCTECNYYCYEVGVLKKHLKKHESQLISCKICQFKCSTPINMEHHMKKHYGIETRDYAPLHREKVDAANEFILYACHFCKFTTKDQKQFLAHKAKHTSSKHFSCTKCGYFCYRAGYLQKHMLMHN